ncbi:MAG: diaminopimelate decarboxylase, partial [Clostridia bacterium]|nr:diaminopimelate decarboxylase [Clostridia bacterium]
MNVRETLKINEKGHLEIGGADAVDLANRFGTPLYVFDEAYIRKMMRIYRQTIEKEYGGKGMPLYASKAFSCKAIYRIAAEENIGVDVVSGGELYTALSAGFPAEKIYMHGNNKLDYEIEQALDAKIGCIVADAYAEIDKIDEECAKRGMKQRILLRINPGIEAHTHAFVQTATTDSKFGFSISNGTAKAVTEYALSKKNILLEGYHCHIGSQIFEKQSFVLAVEKCMAFAK